MSSRNKIEGDVVAEYPFPEGRFLSDERGYSWGLKIIQSVVSQQHGNTFSLKVAPDPKKKGFRRARIMIRVHSRMFSYRLMMNGSKTVKVVRVAEE